MITFWTAGTGKLALARAIQSTEPSQETLCKRHNIPENLCFFCDSSLRDPERLWCNGHERYEDRCFICRPESRDEDRLWCEAHKLYEDECFICRPELQDELTAVEGEDAGPDISSPAQGISSKELQCLEHGVLERECGICHPELIDKLLIGEGLKIRLESSESAEKAGILTTVPTAGTPTARHSFLGKTTYNQNRFARITPLTEGIVQKVLVDVGASVSKGQLLAEISSPEFAQTKSRYSGVLAEKALKKIVFEREQRLLKKKISAQQDYEQARAEYRMAKSEEEALLQQLFNYGLTEKEIKKLEENRSGSSFLPIRAPFAGTLVSRNAVMGEVVRPGDMLFDLADISSMWVEISIPENNLNLVKVNDPVEVTLDVLPEVSVRGHISWVSADIDERTRMIKGRAVVPNTQFLLKQGMFCHINLLSDKPTGALFVSENALHTLNEKPFVFVKLSDDLYEARRITTGNKSRGALEILEGLSPHEEVVVNHSFTLKSEFLKSRLGAGCVDD
jgi:cobalt-zinc-cadmium efflux system membrane fusion protein